MEAKSHKKLFRISEPWGYFPQDVEEAVEKYNEMIIQLERIVLEKDARIAEYAKAESRLKEEVSRMKYQMQMLELPSADKAQEYMALEKFKDSKKSRSEEAAKNNSANESSQPDNKPNLKISNNSGSVFEIVE